MESAEERIFKEKQKAQMIEAREQAKRKQVELDKKRALETSIPKDLPNVEEFTREITRPEIPEKEKVNEPTPVVSSKKPKAGMSLVSRGKKGIDL